MNKNYDLIIIGGGSAGLAAAVSAYENNLRNILIIEREGELGGILNQCIHNGFGLHTFKEELTGPEYADRYIKLVEKYKIPYLLKTAVLGITNQKDVIISSSELGLIYLKAKSIIVTTGCNERTPGQISLPGNRPKGVYTAGLAQKYLNIDGYLVGKNVYILGSGDIGLIMARRMHLEGANVIGVSELMPYSNGLNRNIVQCLHDFNIPLKLHNTVTKIYGKDNLEGIEISEVDDNLKPIKGTEEYIKCDTLLLSVGLYPFSAMLKNAGIKMNPKTKGAFIDQNLMTSTEGIFSSGNVLHVHDLVDYVSEESKTAGIAAANYILGEKEEVINVIETEAKDHLGYLLPNLIRVTPSLNEVSFSFRVTKIISKGKIIIRGDNVVIKEAKRFDLIPSEMQKITLKDINLSTYKIITVAVEEVE